MVMDRAYEGDETRQLVLELGFAPVVPPHPNRRQPWAHDRSLYRRFSNSTYSSTILVSR
jgi:hypothetical protein